jgi:tRNA A-37 threonylcarbamoyl transferase component Bud32
MTYPTDDIPFSLDLKKNPSQNPVFCEQLLRDLKGKRRVYRGSWNDRAVIVKLFLHPQTAQRHWAREKAGVAALKSACVPTPELLFAGKLDDATPALVFDLLPEAQTALQAWNSLTATDQRIEFLRQFVEVIASLHNAGFVQEDLHLENFLVSGGTIYAIDGDAVSNKGHGEALSNAVSSRNLALFFAQLPPKFDAFFDDAVQHYAGLRKIQLKEITDRLTIDLPVVRRRRRHKYVEKCYRSCSEFERSEFAGKIAIVRRDQSGANLAQFLKDPDAFLARGQLLKDGNSSTVVRVQGDHYDWVIKRYNIKSFWHWLSHCFRNTRAWTSWGNAHRLKISGIATPKAIAMVEKRFGPLRSTSYYVSEFIDGPHAEAFFRDNTVPEAQRQLAAQAFVELFRLLRKLGICHGDCKATNFLLRDLTPWVLDLDAMRECSPGAHFEKLAQVDRARFLRNWQTQPELQRWFDEHLRK